MNKCNKKNVIVVNGNIERAEGFDVYLGVVVGKSDRKIGTFVATDVFIAVKDGIILAEPKDLQDDGTYRTNYILDIQDASDVEHIEEEWEVTVDDTLREIITTLPDGIMVENLSEIEAAITKLSAIKQ